MESTRVAQAGSTSYHASTITSPNTKPIEPIRATTGHRRPPHRSAAPLDVLGEQASMLLNRVEPQAEVAQNVR
jgi:hypothetical protein